jgi:predicted porin
MQKKIIALAVAGLVSGVAFAQTNVTVYGVIDQGFAYSSSNAFGNGTNKFSGLKDGGLSGSRFGFKGEEALGNGLKAIFTMEYGKDSDSDTTAAGTNGTNFYVRQAFVGLSNNMGTLTLGRQYNVASDVYGQNSSNGVVNAMPVNALQGALGSQIRSQGGSARQDNVIKYASPDFSGFSVRANYAFGEDGKTYSDPTIGVGDDGRYAVAGSYANGPFGVDLAYAGTSKTHKYYSGIVSTAGAVGGSNTLADGFQNINEWYIGGRYDFKVVKLYASYQDMDNKTDVVNANTGSKMWQVGLSAPVGANGVFQLEYAEIRFDADNYKNVSTTSTATVQADGKNKGFGIGYQHNLSKRTTLYTYVSQLKYDANTGSTSDWIGGIAAAGEKTTTFSAGVRHMF